MTTALFLLVLCAVMLGSGWTLVTLNGRARPLPAAETLLAAFCTGAILLYLLVFAIGTWRLDRASMLAVLGIAGLVALPAWVRALPWLRRPSFGAQPPLALALWAVILLSLVSLLVQGLAPPNDYDSLVYHLTLPKADLERGHIGINWYTGTFNFFPQLSEHLFRLALAVAGEPAAQPVTGLFGFALALGTHALARRLGAGPVAAALAALLVISVRATVWELATAEVEAQIAVYTVLALLAYMEWRERGGLGPALVMGAALAGATLVKYHGFVVAACFLPLIVADVFRRRRRPGEIGWAVVLGLGLMVPHFLRNWAATGNPLFPLFHHVFFPGAPVFLTRETTDYGRSYEFLDFLRVYWDISVLPTHYFDGLMLGAPYLLALAPLMVFAGRASARLAVPGLVVAVIYTAVWFWMMTQQVRFLLPLTPIFSAFAAVGLGAFLIQAPAWGRVAMLAMVAVLAVNQSMFVGIYSLLRLPPALGLVSAADYHAKTPTMTGAFYGICTFTNERLAPGQMVLSLLAPHSYYCPHDRSIQAPAFPDESRLWLSGTPLPPLTAEELAARMDGHRVGLVLVEWRREFRRGPSSAPELVPSDYSRDRIGRLLMPVLAGLAPVYEDQMTRAYDGAQVAAALRARLPAGSGQ